MSRLIVLDAAFVDAYAEATGAKLVLMPYGAHKCRQLGADLSRMASEGTLQQRRTGIQGMAGEGFPKWVYTYRLQPWAILE